MDGARTELDKHVLVTLAAHIAAFEPARLGQSALRTAVFGIADTIGVTLAGANEKSTQILLQTPGIADADGPSLILGDGRRTSMLDAALVNGTASHALDFDDFSDIFGGHQSVPLVPPLFAVADERGLSGRALIDAYTVGFEVEHRFAHALHPHHYDKGWHPTATLGIFGTVAAVSRAVGLDIATMATALAIAASFASGLKANFGSMTKPLHVGHSVRNGLMAVLLAERGFDANTGALEHHQGFFNVFNGTGTFDPTPLVEEWTAPLAIDGPGIGIKQFPCCGSTHPAIAAMLRLAREDGISADDVETLDIHVHPRRLRHTNAPSPATALQAKFSVQYCVARALNDGAVRLHDFEDDAFLQPAIRALLQRTNAHPFADGAGGAWDAEVSVRLKHGRQLHSRIDNMVGRSGDNAMSEAELLEKFTDCATRVLPPAAAERLFGELLSLESCGNVRDLGALLSPPHFQVS